MTAIPLRKWKSASGSRRRIPMLQPYGTPRGRRKTSEYTYVQIYFAIAVTRDRQPWVDTRHIPEALVLLGLLTELVHKCAISLVRCRGTAISLNWLSVAATRRRRPTVHGVWHTCAFHPQQSTIAAVRQPVGKSL